MMKECPSCRRSLVRSRTPDGMVYACPGCKGRAVALPVLRKIGAPRPLLAEIWRKSRDKAARRQRRCPHCSRPMAQVSTENDGEKLTLDVCPTCPAVWFDSSEFESMPVTPPPIPQDEDAHLSLEAREQAALMRLGTLKRQHDSETFMDGPDHGWGWLVGLMGMPVETDAPGLERRPWVTWATIIACVAVTALTFRSGDQVAHQVIREWGFIPGQLGRHGGLTLISSFFLHGGLFHLLGNMYFLFVFGDNTEDRLGRVKYVLLLLLAHVAGSLAEVILSPNPSIPCVGASAGISGVIAYYAISFPKVRLAFMFRYFVYFRWFRIPAIWALALYVLMQLIGSYYQINGFGNVSYLGHTGGLLVGVVAALLTKYVGTRQAQRVTSP